METPQPCWMVDSTRISLNLGPLYGFLQKNASTKGFMRLSVDILIALELRDADKLVSLMDCCLDKDFGSDNAAAHASARTIKAGIAEFPREPQFIGMWVLWTEMFGPLPTPRERDEFRLCGHADGRLSHRLISQNASEMIGRFKAALAQINARHPNDSAS